MKKKVVDRMIDIKNNFLENYRNINITTKPIWLHIKEPRNKTPN